MENLKFKEEISYKIQLEEKNKKEKIAKKLLDGEIDVFDLSDTQTIEMTKYFEEDIQNIDNELERIKIHITKMQKQLKREKK